MSLFCSPASSSLMASDSTGSLNAILIAAIPCGLPFDNSSSAITNVSIVKSKGKSQNPKKSATLILKLILECESDIFD